MTVIQPIRYLRDRFSLIASLAVVKPMSLCQPQFMICFAASKSTGLVHTEAGVVTNFQSI